jgi:hypothetical protein
MEIVIVIVLVLLVVVAIVYLVKTKKKAEQETPPSETETARTIDPSCCGAHEVCDFDLIKMDESIIEYYDDEELDAYKNHDPERYTDSQIDEFRQVLYTLQNKEIRYWLLSLERRKIELPQILQEEARMLMAEG